MAERKSTTPRVRTPKGAKQKTLKVGRTPQGLWVAMWEDGGKVPEHLTGEWTDARRLTKLVEGYNNARA